MYKADGPECNKDWCSFTSIDFSLISISSKTLYQPMENIRKRKCKRRYTDGSFIWQNKSHAANTRRIIIQLILHAAFFATVRSQEFLCAIGYDFQSRLCQLYFQQIDWCWLSSCSLDREIIPLVFICLCYCIEDQRVISQVQERLKPESPHGEEISDIYDW